ncbi:MAG TPA: helix-turn-helix domain-containing protein [Nocardioidaceae bacterium]|nr:helix-turn-helix domain-containing protein [Nocardioidaceae bacterium]
MEPEARRRRAALATYVRSLHHYDIDGFPAGDHVGLPSATVTLVIPVEEPLDLSMPQLTRRRLVVCLAGLHDGPATIHHNGTQRGVQLALSPLHLGKLLGFPATEITGQAVELADVIGNRAAETLSDRLATESEWPLRRRLVEEVLLGQLDRHEPRGRDVRPQVERAWAQMSASGGTARVHDVAADVGWSTRHLVQEFSAAVGLAPKTVARIMRFERSTALVANGHGLALVAARCGFADQAHMTREWQRLAGTTPGRWMRQDVLANVQDSSGLHPDHRRHDTTN